MQIGLYTFIGTQTAIKAIIPSINIGRQLWNFIGSFPLENVEELEKFHFISN